MVVSMTGYANKMYRHTLPNGDILTMTVSIKTLNSRFFELTAKMPYAFSSYELEAQKILKEKLIRGHAYATVHVQDQAVLKNKVTASLPVAAGYLNELQRIQQALGVNGEITINDLARIQQIFSTEESELDESVKNLVLSALSEVADDVTKMRQIEGESLSKDILTRLTTIKELRTSIAQTFSVVFVEKQAELHQKLEALLAGAHQELKDAQKASLINTIDKLDVHEELVRLETHCSTIEQLVISDKIEKGRQLDFMVQELGREANTIASKSINTHITNTAVALKVEIEKMREQIQNII